MSRLVGLLVVVAAILALSSAAGSAGSGQRQIFVTSNADPAAYGQKVVFTATVIPAPPMGGKVVFFNGGTKIGVNELLADGTTTLATRTLALGDHPIVAQLAPSQGGPSASMVQTVQPAVTTTKLFAKPADASLEQPVTLTARVSAAGGAIPVGDVTFYADGVVIGTAAVLDGTGSFDPNGGAFSAGRHLIYAVFTSGSGGFLDSQSASLNEQVSAAPQGFWLVNSAGVVYAYGKAGTFGYLQKQISDLAAMAATPSGHGYWLVEADGEVSPFGDAADYGSPDPAALSTPIVGMAATSDGGGYWLVSAGGHVFAFGDATDYGSPPSVTPGKIVAIATSRDRQGYWLASSSGDVFAFGDAAKYGAIAGTHRDESIADIAVRRDGQGYWLVGSGGSVYAFGDAVNHGSLTGVSLKKPIVGMAPTPDCEGYWLVASNGATFPFGDAVVTGSNGTVVGNFVGTAAVANSATCSR